MQRFARIARIARGGIALVDCVKHGGLMLIIRTSIRNLQGPGGDTIGEDPPVAGPGLWRIDGPYMIIYGGMGRRMG